MRKGAWIGICAVVLGLGAEVASAAVISVAVTAHVIQVNDPSLGVTVGQAVTAMYSYDTTTPVSGSVAGNGDVYLLSSPPANISVSVVGGATYQPSSTWTQQINVTSGPNEFAYLAFPSTSGPAEIILQCLDNDSQWLSPPALPTTPPSLNPQFAGSVTILPPGSSGFTAQIDTVTEVPSITVSPADGDFIAQQNFDAVLLLSAQLSVTGLQASVGGNSIAFTYPGTCQLAAPNGAQRAAIICPNAAAVLAGLGGGSVTINWLVTLADGSTLQRSSLWSLIL